MKKSPKSILKILKKKQTKQQKKKTCSFHSHTANYFQNIFGKIKYWKRFLQSSQRES